MAVGELTSGSNSIAVISKILSGGQKSGFSDLIKRKLRLPGLWLTDHGEEQRE